MIGKSFLGESLNFLIGKLKLSYRRIFPITGESLAAVRRELRRGDLFGIFIAEYAMKPRFFWIILFLCWCIFACFWKTNPMGLSFYCLLMQGWRFASTLPCQKYGNSRGSRRLFVSESARELCHFRWEVGAFIGAAGCDEGISEWSCAEMIRFQAGGWCVHWCGWLRWSY